MVLLAWAWEVHAVRLDGERETRPMESIIADSVIPLGDRVFASSFSPDGKWIVYGGRGAEANEIYVIPFPARGLRTQIPRAAAPTPSGGEMGKRSSTAKATRSSRCGSTRRTASFTPLHRNSFSVSAFPMICSGHRNLWR